MNPFQQSGRDGSQELQQALSLGGRQHRLRFFWSHWCFNSKSAFIGVGNAELEGCGLPILPALSSTRTPGGPRGGSVIHGTCMTWTLCMPCRVVLFNRTMDLTNSIKAVQCDQTNSEQAKQAEQASQDKLSKQRYQPNKHWQGQVLWRASTLLTGSTARTSSQ